MICHYRSITKNENDCKNGPLLFATSCSKNKKTISHQVQLVIMLLRGQLYAFRRYCFSARKKASISLLKARYFDMIVLAIVLTRYITVVMCFYGLNGITAVENILSSSQRPYLSATSVDFLHFWKILAVSAFNGQFCSCYIFEPFWNTACSVINKNLKSV